MEDSNNYYDKIPDELKRDIAFNVVASVREAVNLARKTGAAATYEQALQITHDVDPKLYEFCTKQLTKKNENDLVKLFKEKAAAQSLLQGTPINPIDLLEEEAAEYKTLLENPELEKGKTRTLKNHIVSLEAAMENLRPRKLSEHRILERDFCKVDRSKLGAELHFQADDYIDYKVNAERYLRLRILHPDKPEHILGADLIYEQLNVSTEQVRIAVLQYKTWDNGVLYVSNSNGLERQLEKMQRQVCDRGICQGPESLKNELNYRFPYCSAFLRPTDKIQTSDSKMISHGIHIPVCSAIQIKNDNANKIEKSQIRHSTLTHDVFENLFNHGFIGSRWLDVSELEEFYRDMRVLTQTQTLKLYAKEIIGADHE